MEYHGISWNIMECPEKYRCPVFPIKPLGSTFWGPNLPLPDEGKNATLLSGINVYTDRCRADFSRWAPRPISTGQFGAWWRSFLEKRCDAFRSTSQSCPSTIDKKDEKGQFRSSLVGGLVAFFKIFPYSYWVGMSSSQLTKSIIFQDGVFSWPTNQLGYDNHSLIKKIGIWQSLSRLGYWYWYYLEVSRILGYWSILTKIGIWLNHSRYCKFGKFWKFAGFFLAHQPVVVAQLSDSSDWITFIRWGWNRWTLMSEKKHAPPGPMVLGGELPTFIVFVGYNPGDFNGISGGNVHL